jgi:hypothetical protein
MLEPLVPCGGMSEPLALRKVTSINSTGRFLTTGEPLPRLYSQLPQVGWYCQLPEVVCQNCWLPAEKNQLTDRHSVSESSFVWLPPLIFYSRVPLLFHKNWEQVTTRRASRRWKALIQWDAARCPEGIVSDTAVTMPVPVPCSPWHDTSHLGFSGPQPCSPSKDVTPPPSTRTPRVGFWTVCLL